MDRFKSITSVLSSMTTNIPGGNWTINPHTYIKFNYRQISSSWSDDNIHSLLTFRNLASSSTSGTFSTRVEI